MITLWTARIEAVFPQLEHAVYGQIAKNWAGGHMLGASHDDIARGPYCTDATKFGKAFLKQMGVADIRGELHRDVRGSGLHAFLSLPAEAPESFTSDDIVIDLTYKQFSPGAPGAILPNVFLGRRDELVAQFAHHISLSIGRQFESDTLIGEFI